MTSSPASLSPATLSDETVETLLRLSKLAQSAGETAHDLMAQVIEAAGTRWFIVQMPIVEALEIEQDPPYETSRVQADLGHRKPRNAE